MAEQHPPHDGGSPCPHVGKLTGAQVAHIAISSVAATMADDFLMLVPTAGHRRRGTAGLTRTVVDLRRKLTELMARAITADRMDGADWADIGAALGMDPDLVAYHYAHLDWTHMADDPQAVWDAFRPNCVAQLHDSCDEDPAVAAAKLDVWYHRHADPHEAAPVPADAVTAGL
ncbi:hypothetical protein ACFWYW_56815 [Nonomuraea sp. NPDC059023]|uniref:hypothetical protein n=1 Tax=unclassified Nonomuraea TaxID=2593643 RepID=UPI0036BA470A